MMPADAIGAEPSALCECWPGALCLCTPFKTTGGLRTHRNGVEARQVAADFAEAPPGSIPLGDLPPPAQGREKADRPPGRGEVEGDDAVTRSLPDLGPDKARPRR